MLAFGARTPRIVGLSFGLAWLVLTSHAGLTAAQSAIKARVDTNRPDDSRFTPTVLVPHGELDEPMVVAVLPDERALIAERKGALKVYDPSTNTTSVVATIPVNSKYYSAAGVVREAEEGLIGLTIDPNFSQNHWIYLRYADPQVAKHVLARWELRDLSGPSGQTKLTLVESSKRVLLENPAQRERCCHTGGGMAWDKRGNLYITVGNNTGGGMTDERPGNESADDQRTAANTNDLRGKILRIHPEPDGTYTIPPDNLFPPGTPRTRPEIYAMGMRNPWRVSVDSRTGYVYWGEVGPGEGRPTGGPIPYDEYNQARGPGFFGFPYFVGENEGFGVRDYLKNELRPARDPKRPFNESVNNSGLRELPPAQPAFIAYSYETSEKFPELGSGAHSAVGGPIYHRTDLKPDAKRPFPSYYEGKWIIAEFERGLIMSVTMDEDSRYVSMDQFLPSYRPLEPIDITFGPEGDLYVLDYGSVWFGKSPDSSLVKIEYNAGNRKPSAVARANTRGGPVPLSVSLSADGSSDPDGDKLQYVWKVGSASGSARTYTGANPAISLGQPGAYMATLTVTDPSGANSSSEVSIVAGNTPPVVNVSATGLNRTFLRPGQPIAYSVNVSDREDREIQRDRVALSINHVPDGVDVTPLADETGSVDATTRFGVAKMLMARSDCMGCHQRDTPSVGPTYQMLAAKYRTDPTTLGVLANKVKTGGSKVWGEAEMPPHPTLTTGEIKTILEFMLSAAATTISELPLEGSQTPDVPDGRGRVVVRAVYTDKSTANVPTQTSVGMAVLRAPTINPASADVYQDVTFGARSSRAGANTRGLAITALKNGYIGFRQLDLTGLRELTVTAITSGDMSAKGGVVDVRLDSPTGPSIGSVVVEAGPASQAAANRQAGAPTRTVALNPTTGLHDLYLVFQNDKARTTEPLMTVSAIVVN